MKEYCLNTYNELDWETVPKAFIDTFKWADNNYKPECFAQCALLSDGLHIRLTAYESTPRAVCNNFGDPVCTDSCLEFFACFDSNSEEYVNFEFNAKGTMLATLRGTDGSITAINEIIALPDIIPTINDDFWTIEFMLTFEQISALFPNAQISSGKHFRANFYKCGDKTEAVHYGMWNEVTGDPNFHVPKYFGKINIA